MRSLSPAVLLLAAAPALATPPPIVNGEVEEGFPSVVSLGAEFNGQYFSLCTGTLITPRVVLSAGHCGEDIPLEAVISLGVAFFGTEIDSADQVGLVDLHIHPDYEPLESFNLPEYDIGIIVLEEDAPEDPTWFRQHAFEDDDLDTWMTSVGFGVTSSAGNGSGTKRSVELQLDDYDEQFLRVETYTAQETGQICSGDSGGPQFAEVDGRWVQWGIHSWGDQNCQYESGSTRTDLGADWIMEIVEEVHGTDDLCEINGINDNGACDEDICPDDPECEDGGDGGDGGSGDGGGSGGDGGSGGGSAEDEGGGGCAVAPAPTGALTLLGLLGVLGLRRRT